jgi:hypothetical protein
VKKETVDLKKRKAQSADKKGKTAVTQVETRTPNSKEKTRKH